MPGLSDRAEAAVLNGISGQPANATAWPTTLYLALFNAIGKDAGTGFTEVSGTAYARVQVSGTLNISSGQGAPGTVLTFTSVPSWIVAGMSVFDVTHPADITAGTTVVSTTATTVTLSAPSGTAVATSDVIQFSAFTVPVAGEPSTVSNSAAITFPQAGAGGWTTAVAWGLYDSSGGGNLWFWDYLGNFPWVPIYIGTFASGWAPNPGNYFTNDSFIYSNEVAGTLPTFTTGGFSLTGDGATGVSPVLTISGISGATFTVQNGVTAVNANVVGSGMTRKIIQQSIPVNTVVSFAANSLVISGA